MLTIYIVSWRYTDGSGSGPVCALWSKPAAERMLEILCRHAAGMKLFHVDAVPCEELP